MNIEMFEKLLNEFCLDCKVTNKNQVIISRFSSALLTFIWVDRDGVTYKRIYDNSEDLKTTIVSEPLKLNW